LRLIDAQIHTWIGECTEYPWLAEHPTRWHFAEREVPTSDALAAMDAVGVDAALSTVPALYGYDNAYALAGAAANPGRLAVVGLIDPDRPDHRDRLGTLMRQPGMVGIRITGGDDAAWRGGRFDPLIRAAGELRVPVCVYPGLGNLGALDALLQRQDATQIILDHVGLAAPPVTVRTAGTTPFAALPTVLALARFENLAIKLTALPALSRETFPFRDIWLALARVLDAFGAERVMWGTDFTRTARLHSYLEGTRYLDYVDGLDALTKEQLYGGTLQAVFGWPR
jgi:L-fuconolactonase